MNRYCVAWTNAWTTARGRNGPVLYAPKDWSEPGDLFYPEATAMTLQEAKDMMKLLMSFQAKAGRVLSCFEIYNFPTEDPLTTESRQEHDAAERAAWEQVAHE